jgi:hypothetical protein
VDEGHASGAARAKGALARADDRFAIVRERRAVWFGLRAHFERHRLARPFGSE